MPKNIPNLKEKLTETGRKLLFSEGYEGLTMRKVADACGIALGTCYNYFESKDMLVANVMLCDWMELLKRLKESFYMASDEMDKARSIYAGVKEFSVKYEAIWDQYGGSGRAVKKEFDRHGMLIGQLMEISGLSKFVIEVLVHFATVDDMSFDEMEADIQKLL